MKAAGLKYALKLEDALLCGTKLWSAMTEQGKFKKLYFVGPKGNLAEEVAESFMDSCAYIPAADGTLYMQRKQTVEYAPFDYHFVDSDAEIKIMCRKQGVDHVTMYSEDEAQYREMETAVLKKFSEHDETKEPCAIVVGESALNQPENKEFLKEGIVIYLKCSPEASWKAINTRPGAGTGLYISSQHTVKPPVWALAQDLQGDIDNADGREEYIRILNELDKEYEATQMPTDKLLRGHFNLLNNVVGVKRGVGDVLCFEVMNSNQVETTRLGDRTILMITPNHDVTATAPATSMAVDDD